MHAAYRRCYMNLQRIPYELSICKVASVSAIDLSKDFFFIGKTDEEVSLVCRTEDIPADVTDREDGWKCFRIEGTLDFSIVGIISELSNTLADNGIAVFVVSTFNTDYVLVKKEKYEQAITILDDLGYGVS